MNADERGLAERPPWLVKVYLADDYLSGAGFLVDDEHVVTCAHVLTYDQQQQERPDHALSVAFQYAGVRRRIPATLVDEGWMPRHPETRAGDVAVLKLHGPLPSDARPAPLRTAAYGTGGHTFAVYGYPKPHDDGVPTTGVVIGPAGDGLLSLLTVEGGRRIEQGFSGAPLWDATIGAVIGMVREVEPRDEDARQAYAMDVDNIAGVWPPLDDLVNRSYGHIVDPTLLALVDDAGHPPLVADVDIYDVGVSPSRYEGGDDRYVPRNDVDTYLNDAWRSEPFIIAIGPPKAGATRSAIELLRRVAGDHRLLVPRDAKAMEQISVGALPDGGAGLVVWLDKLDEYAGDHGLDARPIDAFRRRDPPVPVVATASRRWLNIRGGRLVPSKVRRAEPVKVPRELGDADLAVAHDLYQGHDFIARGIGLELIAATELDERYATAKVESPEGWAVVRSVVDPRRCGLPYAVPESLARRLFPVYFGLVAPDREGGQDEFDAGLDWARRSVVRGTELALIHVGTSDYLNAFDYLLASVDGLGDQPAEGIPDATWDVVIDESDADDLVGVVYAALARDRPDRARQALDAGLESTEASDRPEIRSRLLLLASGLDFNDGQLGSAIARLEEVERMGVPTVVPLAQAELGSMYTSVGDVDRAETVLRAALDSGNEQARPFAQLNLGVLLMNLGDSEQAVPLLEAALGNDDPENGDLAESYASILTSGRQNVRDKAKPVGSDLRRPQLTESSDKFDPLAGAMSTSSRDLVGPMAQANLLGLQASSGVDPEVVRESLSAAVESANDLALPIAQVTYASFLIDTGESDEALRLLRSAASADRHPIAPLAHLLLGGLLIDEDREDEGLPLVEDVANGSHPLYAPAAAAALGQHLHEQNRTDDAVTWFRRAIDFSTSPWSTTAQIALAELYEHEGDPSAAERELVALRWFDGTDVSALAADLVGDLWARQGDPVQAAAWYERAINHNDPAVTPMAKVDLALVLSEAERHRAKGLLEEVARSDDAFQAPRAADLLGDVYKAENDPARAEVWYRRAMDFVGSGWDLQAHVDLAEVFADGNNVAAALELCRTVVDTVERSDSPSANEVEAQGRAKFVAGLIGMTEDGDTSAARRDLGDLTTGPDASQAAAAAIELARWATESDDPDGAAQLLCDVLDRPDLPDRAAAIVGTHLAIIRFEQDRLDEVLELLGGSPAEDAVENPALEAASSGGVEEIVTKQLAELALELFEQDELTLAIRLAEAIKRREVADPVRANALLVTGMFQVSQRDLDRAIATLTEVTELAGPTSSTTLAAHRFLASSFYTIDRGSAFYGKDRAATDEKARAHARQTIDYGIGPDRDAALLLLGEVDQLASRNEPAREALFEARQSSDPVVARRATTSLVELLRDLGERDEAGQIVQELLPTLDPEVIELAKDLRVDHKTIHGPIDIGTVPQRPVERLPTETASAEIEEPHPSLPPDVMLLIARVAEAEGDDSDAMRWRRRATAG